MRGRGGLEAGEVSGEFLNGGMVVDDGGVEVGPKTFVDGFDELDAQNGIEAQVEERSVVADTVGV